MKTKDELAEEDGKKIKIVVPCATVNMQFRI